MCKYLAALLPLFLLFFAIGTEAAPRSGEEGILLKLQKKYQSAWSLECDFSQTAFSSGRIKKGKGQAVFYRPAAVSRQGTPAGSGVMRWEYTDPDRQTIINDGREITLYTPKDRQAIIVPAGEMEADPSYALLTGSATLTEAFTASSPDPLFSLSDPSPGCTAILLTPAQPHPQVKRIQIWFDKELHIRRLLMEDHFASLTELSFSTIRLNTLPASDQKQRQALLHLDLPPGTEIIRQ